MNLKHQTNFLRQDGRLLRTLWLLLAMGLCIGSRPARAQLTAIDIGLQSKFQDTYGGYHKRGRACVAADFDLDGRVDFYIGNPGDESFVIKNTPGPGGAPIFEPVQTLLSGELAWGAVSVDYDNDGDYDLFITIGGNEGVGFDFLFQNLWLETGQFSFQDVTDQAGVKGPIPPGGTNPIPVASANAVAGDYDRDSDVDIFVNVSTTTDGTIDPSFLGRNILWENNGDDTFTDVTDAVGLGTSKRDTRHSSFLDIDNDGDLDLYESNFEDDNILWENSLVETGAATFTDVTAAMSLPGEDLRFPYETFASAAADFNNDGWQDIIAFHRFQAGEPPDSPYGDGHAIFLNVGGTGFMNVAEQAGINNPFQSVNGVMGCQVGDLNGDGLPDVFIGNGGMFGNGGMSGGQVNQLFLSTALEGGIPRYVDRSDLIDFPAPEDPTLTYPLYPYRTHGTAFVDVDGDGVQEIAETNGGPASMPDEVREPNRLFTFEGNLGFNYFKVHPVGDGVSVSLDAIGTRFALTVSKSGGRPSTLWNTLFAGSGFSAQNGFDVYFGLKDADTMKSLRVFWPNGVVQTITQGLSVNSRVVVTIGGAAAPGPAPDDFPAKAELESNYPNPSNPETWVPYRLARESQVTLTIYNMMGQVVQTIEVGHRPAGVYTSKDRAIYWDGRNDRGERAASGVYFYTLTAGDFTATRKMLILE